MGFLQARLDLIGKLRFRYLLDGKDAIIRQIQEGIPAPDRQELTRYIYWIDAISLMECHLDEGNALMVKILASERCESHDLKRAFECYRYALDELLSHLDELEPDLYHFPEEE